MVVATAAFTSASIPVDGRSKPEFLQRLSTFFSGTSLPNGFLHRCSCRSPPYQSSVVRLYNNLQDRGDCQTTRKSYKTSHIVGWVVGWKKFTHHAATPHVRFPRTPFLDREDRTVARRNLCGAAFLCKHTTSQTLRRSFVEIKFGSEFVC
jgi:hypothetical protein